MDGDKQLNGERQRAKQAEANKPGTEILEQRIENRVSSCAPWRGDSPFAAALLTTAKWCNSPTGQPTTHKQRSTHTMDSIQRGVTQAPASGADPKAPSQMKAATHGRTRVVGSVSVSCPDQANPDRVDLGARGLAGGC